MIRLAACLGLVIGGSFWLAAIIYGCGPSQHTADVLAAIGCPAFLVSFMVLSFSLDRHHAP